MDDQKRFWNRARMPGPVGRETPANALVSESAEPAKVLNEVHTSPSAPTIQVLAQAVGRAKKEINALLESATRFDAAARDGERDGDQHRVR